MKTKSANNLTGNSSLAVTLPRKPKTTAPLAQFDAEGNEHEFELRVSEEKYRRLVENSLVGIFCTSVEDGQFLETNTTLKKMLGFNDLTGVKSVDLYVNPADRAVLKMLLQQYGLVENFETRLKRADGQIIWVSFTSKLNPQEGVIEGVMADITERKQAEMALAEERNLLRTLIDNLPDQIYVKDNQGRHLITNLAVAESVGAANSEELIGQSNFDLYPPDMAAQYHVDDQVVLRSGQPSLNREETIINALGEKRWQLTTKAPLRDRSGKIVGLVGMSRDITAQKKAEEEREYLLEAEHEHRLLAETLAEVTLALTAQTSHAAVLEEILRQVQRIIPCQKASIRVLVDGNTLRIVHRQGQENFEKGVVSNLDQPLSNFPRDADVIRSRQTLIIPDTQNDPYWVILPNSFWVRSHIAAPICLGDQVLGLLRLDADVPYRFSLRDVERLKPLVNAAALALENARLHDQARREIAERKRVEEALLESQTRLKLLNSISTGITSGMSVEQVIERTVKHISDYFSTLQVAYSTIDENGLMTIVHSVDPPGMAHLTGSLVDLKTAPGYLSTLRQRKRVIIANISEDSNLAALSDYFAEIGLQAILEVPVHHSDNLVGTLYFGSPTARQWSQHEITTLTEVAEYLSITLQNVHDQQERERAEKELRANEELFRLVTASISDHIYVTRVAEDGRRSNLYISPHAEAMTGYPLENFMNDWRFWPSTVIHPDDRETAASQAKQLALGQHSEVEYRLVRADSKIIWVRDSARVRSEEGATAKITYGLVSDITERKQAELEREWLTNELRNINQTLDERVQARTAELQAIFDAAGEGIVVTNLNGIIEYINPAMEKLSGFTSLESIGHTPSIWRSERQNATFYNQMWQTIKSGHTWRSELVNKRKNGSLYHAMLTITPIPGPHGKPVGFVGVQSDITPFKEMDRLKSEFVSMAAHELRTPLTSILGFSEILLTRQLAEDRKTRYLTFINQQATALRAILDDLLDLSRLESGQGFEITESLIDLKAIVTETVFGFQENNPKHRYQIQGPEIWPQVKGDPVKLAQLLKNLFSNATKYSPAGGTISLTAVHNQEYGLLHLSLTDQGIGMTPEQVGQVFDRFFRADASNTAIGGTGLGMTISRLIVERHGGKIWLESEYGLGTTVHLIFPLVNRHTYILIIEDDQSLRELQQRVLRGEGFTVVGVEEGHSGLKFAQTCLPDLILLDLALPGMAGFEVLERLQGDYLTKDIPVVITSAIDTTAEIERAIQNGASDYLVKPYGMGDLTVRVNRALTKSPTRTVVNSQPVNKAEKKNKLTQGAIDLKGTLRENL